MAHDCTVSFIVETMTGYIHQRPVDSRPPLFQRTLHHLKRFSLQFLVTELNTMLIQPSLVGTSMLTQWKIL